MNIVSLQDFAKVFQEQLKDKLCEAGLESEYIEDTAYELRIGHKNVPEGHHQSGIVVPVHRIYIDFEELPVSEKSGFFESIVNRIVTASIEHCTVDKNQKTHLDDNNLTEEELFLCVLPLKLLDIPLKEVLNKCHSFVDQHFCISFATRFPDSIAFVNNESINELLSLAEQEQFPKHNTLDKVIGDEYRFVEVEVPVDPYDDNSTYRRLIKFTTHNLNLTCSFPMSSIHYTALQHKLDTNKSLYFCLSPNCDFGLAFEADDDFLKEWLKGAISEDWVNEGMTYSLYEIDSNGLLSAVNSSIYLN